MTVENAADIIGNYIFDCDCATFPVLMEKLKEIGIEPTGNLDYVSKKDSHCMFWAGLSHEAILVLREVERKFDVCFQPFGYNPAGLTLYKEYFPNEKLYDFMKVKRMTKKKLHEFMGDRYFIPVYWVDQSKSHIIR